MATISKREAQKVYHMYCEKKMSMRGIAEDFGVSLDAVVYAMRKYNIVRRSFSEVNQVRFEQKKPSFSIQKGSSQKKKELEAIGAMLYWAEGHDTEKATGIDFANSDPKMVKIFVDFLRSRYVLDEKRLRGSLYCYSNQDPKHLIQFWSKITGIPKSQFIKPYVRKDFRDDGRRMRHGLVHVRYSDKKLLMDIRSLIESYKQKYARR